MNRERKNVDWKNGRKYNEEEMQRYEDIIHLPHHVSSSHPPMPVRDRAAQFAPFAALTGYEAAIRETARLTEEKIELDESILAALDGKLQMVKEQMAFEPVITVTYFKPDRKKQGGAYVTIKEGVKKIDDHARVLIMEDGEKIPFDDIVGIEKE